MTHWAGGMTDRSAGGTTLMTKTLQDLKGGPGWPLMPGILSHRAASLCSSFCKRYINIILTLLVAARDFRTPPYWQSSNYCIFFYISQNVWWCCKSCNFLEFSCMGNCDHKTISNTGKVLWNISYVMYCKERGRLKILYTHPPAITHIWCCWVCMTTECVIS